MENLSLSLLFIIFFCFLVVCNGIESPQFTVIHSESDFEVRLYRESSWMSAPVRGISFEKATKEGFHRVYQYIHGANSNSSHLMMTAPVLTSIFPNAHGSGYFVRFYVSANYLGGPPLPRPEQNLQFENWGGHCVAVRKFSGFATDNSIIKELEALMTSLSRSLKGNSAALDEKSAYAIAQYNASSHLDGRLNEVWMNVSTFTREGCPSYQLFQYIQGANLNSSRIRMTAPVLTSIVSGEGPLHSSAYFVRFYLPVKFQESPPIPLTELNLQSDAWGSHCIAVRKFSGFARDSNIVEEAEKLAVSLGRSPWANSTASEGKYAYSIAQYNSPFRFIGRVNEVWVEVDGSEMEGCGSNGVAIY